jgi:phage baseplate assembly protein W
MAAHLDIPFGFAATGRTATTGDDDHIRDMIKAVLFTAPGERVNRPEFGCGIRQLVFAPLSDTLAATTQQLVHGALLRWLRDVILVESVTVEAVDATLSISVTYAVQETAERQTAVFERAIAA